jgi:hypothetical protein
LGSSSALLHPGGTATSVADARGLLYQNMSIQGTVGKKKYVMLTIPQKLDKIWRLEIGENQREIVTSYKFGSSTSYDIEKQKNQLGLFIASNESVKHLFRPETLRESKLAQLDKVHIM